MPLYKVVAYVRAEGEPEDYLYYRDIAHAHAEVEHCSLMQPENIYEVEEVDEDDIPNKCQIYEPIEPEDSNAPEHES